MPPPVETTEIARFSELRKMDLFDDLCDHILVPMAKQQTAWWFKPSQSYLLTRGYTLSGNGRRAFQYWYQANWRELAKRAGVAPANSGAANEDTAIKKDPELDLASLEHGVSALGLPSSRNDDKDQASTSSHLTPPSVILPRQVPRQNDRDDKLGSRSTVVPPMHVVRDLPLADIDDAEDHPDNVAHLRLSNGKVIPLEKPGPVYRFIQRWDRGAAKK